MEFKGTKGKWQVFDDYIQDESGGLIADCFPTSKEDRANALLISKAPEMLEILKRISYNLKNEECPFDEDEIDRLIKEATEIK